MSISYNRRLRKIGRLRAMNISFLMNKPSVAIALILLTLLPCAVVSRAAGPASKSESSPLASLAFFTAHEWDAKLPDSPDGKKISIHARFTWSEGRQVIRISNELVTDGQAAPYVEGMYAWHPEKKALWFVYVSAEGNVSEGIVRLEDGKLVHEFREIRKDGNVGDYVARVTPHGTESWENAIFARKGDTLTPLVQVQYLPAQ